MYFWQKIPEYREVLFCPSQCDIKRHMISICPITGDASFHLLVNAMSARILNCTVTVFPSVVSSLCGVIFWDYVHILFLIDFHPSVLTSTHDSWTNQFLFQWLPHCNFSNSIILSTFICWNATIRKTFPSFPFLKKILISVWTHGLLFYNPLLSTFIFMLTLVPIWPVEALPS